MFLANAFWTTQQWIINQQPVSKQINTRTVLFELPAYLISRLNSTPSERKKKNPTGELCCIPASRAGPPRRPFA